MVESMQEIFGSIGDGATGVSDRMKQVAGDAFEQNDAISSLRREISLLGDTVQSSAASSEELSASAHQTSAGVADLQGLVSRFRVRSPIALGELGD